MSDNPHDTGTSTPAASAKVAQSRGDEAVSRGHGGRKPARALHSNGRFDVGLGVTRPAVVRTYERAGSDPIYRPLKIFTVDPSRSRLEGATADINVSFEPLEPGPVGRIFAVDDVDDWQKVRYRGVDLDDPAILIRGGREPSPSDHLFHQQMVYAVCSSVYATFRAALGRQLTWRKAHGDVAQLRLRPHAFRGSNAYYSAEEGEIAFGYYLASKASSGRNLPEGFVFTCLSHDIVVHETTHALLDGLRSHFTVPSGADVLAFHEAFADLVSIFQRFSYREVVLSAIQASRGRISHAQTLTDLAIQFGHTTGSERALRSALDTVDGKLPPKDRHGVATEPHARGSILLAAVFEAFVTVFERKTRRYVRLATGGSGVLGEGELPDGLAAVLAGEASKLASQFLAIAIRAIDYCPPVDLEFGEFLRAMITADFDLVPDDPWAYREALVDAFQRRGIFPSGVLNLAEDALRWRPTERHLGSIRGLRFARLRFHGDPCWPTGRQELGRQARVLGEFVTRPEHLSFFGLALPDHPGLRGDAVDRPVVQSIRSSRRVGPDGQIVFDLVAEITQRRRARCGDAECDFFGGATIILGPDGDLRYAIVKDVTSDRRLRAQLEFMQTESGCHLWPAIPGVIQRRAPAPQLFRLLDAANDAE